MSSVQTYAWSDAPRWCLLGLPAPSPDRQVVDLTELILANRGPLADPLIAAAGTDVSHWFSLQPPASDGKKRRTGGSGGGLKSGPTNATTNEDDRGGGDRRQDECEVAGDPRTFVDPQTGLTVPYLPMGRLV